MSKDKEIRFYNNKNGELGIVEMAKIKRDNKVREHIAKFRVVHCPCPDTHVRDSDAFCFHCEDCWFKAFDKIKILKDGFKIGRKKYIYD